MLVQPDDRPDRPRRLARGRSPAPRAAGLLLAAAVLALFPRTAAADIFSYTDAKGVLHLTNKPGGDRRFRVFVKSPPSARRTSAAAVPPSDGSPERFTRYAPWIQEAATTYRIPEELIRAVIKCESDYDPRAVSRAGAQGIMQLMPETAARMGVRDAFEPREAILGGARYLRLLMDAFGGDLERVVAAYNAGEAAVVRYAGIPPYEETRGYVARVLAFYRRYRTAET
jgi:soluble lytic murein transglycosylase-like protein